MARIVFHWLLRLWPFLVSAFGVVYLAMVLTPGARWYHADILYVHDPEVGQPIEVEYSGGPHLPFTGAYSVTIRRVSTGELICDPTSGAIEYKPGTARPDPLFMDWWANNDDRCIALQEGTYQMGTCWQVLDPFFGIVPPKTQCVTSNPFRIYREAKSKEY